jgi:predicted Zn-dependent protease with MMP-like domain
MVRAMTDMPTEGDDAAADAFEALVDGAIAGLPGEFRSRLGSVAIVIADEPTPDELESVRAHGLFGLYVGIPRTVWSADNAMVPSKITIFRGPLERANPDPRSLATAVEDVVRHEVAHHFGIDDAHLGDLARGRGRRDGYGAQRR